MRVGPNHRSRPAQAREARRHLALLPLAAALALSILAVAASSASASKEVVSYFGTASESGSKGGEFSSPQGIAVNSTGAGAGDLGDVYVVDSANNRIQRFALDDNGSPAVPYDDEYRFVSAWGADVNAVPDGGSDYEICTVAAECQAAEPSPGNGSTAGNGGLGIFPRSIAIDQDTGLLYVADARNHRLNVYGGDGAFVRSFGADVVASGPGDTGTGYEVCVATDGDICKAGAPGAGLGQFGSFSGDGTTLSPPDGDPDSGTVYVSDTTNRRVATFDLDGSDPASFGSAAEFPQQPYFKIAIDSRGILYFVDQAGPGQQIGRYDTLGVNGAVGFLAPIESPPLLPAGGGNGTIDIQVDPDTDAGGPDTDELYALRESSPASLSSATAVQQFGPINDPGLVAPPTATDDVHGSNVGFTFVSALGLDYSRDRLFVGTGYGVDGEYNQNMKGGVYVLDTAGAPPTASTDSISDVTASSATIHGTVNPGGPPDVSFRLEYSLDGTNWLSTPSQPVGSQATPQPIDALLSPPGGGLEPGTAYHVRIVAVRPFNPPAVGATLTFTTATPAPAAETTGAPVRTAKSAQLTGRVNPQGAAATYRFEYGTAGPCGANPCESSSPVAAGSGRVLRLVAEEVDGLAPGTTYHYRLVADNGQPGSPSNGEDMTVTTRADDDPLDHGAFAGPPGSDRAWEQVNPPETGGNPVVGALGASSDGNRVVYQIAGGNPGTDSGANFNLALADRTVSGWEFVRILPLRAETAGPNWLPPAGDDDLTTIVDVNWSPPLGTSAYWRLTPGGAATPLMGPFQDKVVGTSGSLSVSADGSRVIAAFGKNLDPAFPEPFKENPQLYDISSGAPKLATVLPGEVVPPCGTDQFQVAENAAPRNRSPLSVDGRLLVFAAKANCADAAIQLYIRDLEAASTKRISPPPISGLACDSSVLSWVADSSSYFFWAQSRLSPEDTNPTVCATSSGNNDKDGDVYRYDLASETLDCITCLVPGLDADVDANTRRGSAATRITVAPDGSRLYFASPNRLVPGAPSSGGAYRLALGSGDLRYLGDFSFGGLGVGSNGLGTSHGNATDVSADGKVLLFLGKSPSLNPVDGTDNGGKAQFYRYDDEDGSLVCVSCPQDGSPAKFDVSRQIDAPANPEQVGPNVTPLSADGDVFAFTTSSALVQADQNTAGAGEDPVVGADVYEWRDGRQMLVSDGITNWPSLNASPTVNMVSPSGNDVFFTASAALTPDALDGWARLYDARIGGGFEFPAPPPPCPLEVCQGEPKPAPAEEAPGTANFSGPGNRPNASSPSGRKTGKKCRKKAKKKCRKAHKSSHKHGGSK